MTALICKNPAKLNFILIVSVNLCLYNMTKEEKQSTRRDDHETSIWSIMSSTAILVKGPGELFLTGQKSNSQVPRKLCSARISELSGKRAVLIFQEGDHVLFWHHYSNFTLTNKAINK